MEPKQRSNEALYIVDNIYLLDHVNVHGLS